MGAPPLPESEPATSQEEDPKDDETSSVGTADTDVKDETAAQKLLRAARNKYIERGITGTICLSRLRGIVSHSLSCSITEEDIPDIVDGDDLEGLGRMDKRMISLFDALIKQLEKASKAWDNHPYADKVTICRSSQLGFYLPIFVSAGFMLEISLEADVTSLCKSRARRAKVKEFKKALKTIDESLVEGVMQQGGFPLLTAQQAVIATGNTSVDAALAWAVSRSKDNLLVQKDLEMPELSSNVSSEEAHDMKKEAV